MKRVRWRIGNLQGRRVEVNSFRLDRTIPLEFEKVCRKEAVGKGLVFQQGREKKLDSIRKLTKTTMNCKTVFTNKWYPKEE